MKSKEERYSRVPRGERKADGDIQAANQDGEAPRGFNIFLGQKVRCIFNLYFAGLTFRASFVFISWQDC